MEVAYPWNQFLPSAPKPHPLFGGPLSLFFTHGCKKILYAEEPQLDVKVA